MSQQRIWLVAVACVIALGCEIPTEAPIIEQRWVLPLDPVVLEQEELLPSSVSIVGDLYDVAVDPATESESLASLCPGCTALDGLTVPVPAFTGSFVSHDPLPVDVLEASVASGSIDVTVTNGLSFDPLDNGGTVTITIAGASGGPILGSLVFADATDDLPPASVTTRSVLLSSGTVIGAIETRVDVDVPGGQVATIDVSDIVQVDAVTTSLLVTGVSAGVSGRSASLTDQELDTEDVDADIVEKVQSGAILLDVQNPFSITFDGTIRIGAIVKTVFVSDDATSQVSIAFTGDELRSFLGVPGITFSGDGILGGGPAIVTPSAELEIDPSIDLVIELGG